MNLPPGWRHAGPFRSNAGYRETVRRAREEAANRNHRAIRPVHILAGLVYERDARVTAVFDDLGISIDDFAERASEAIGPTLPPDPHSGPDLAFTHRGAAVLEGAARAAERMRHDWLGAVHFLAALSEETWGGAPRVLREAGATHATLLPVIQSVATRLPPVDRGEANLFVIVRDT